MGRSTVYNNITSPEKIAAINPENITLMNDFLEYLESVGRAESTIKNYKADLLVFFCWCEDNLNNKYFVDLTKREISRFQNHALNVWGWSSNRLRTVKAALSSLSNFIENILDDEIKGFKPIVRKIENPVKEAVREKSVFLTQDIVEIADKLVEMGEYQKACALMLAAASGRRKSELCRFKVSFFDDENIIYGSLYKSPEKIRTKGRGKQGKQLNVYVLAKLFKKYFDLWMAERERLGIQSEWLLVNYNKATGVAEQLSPTTLDSWATTINSMSKAPFYWHSLRHMFVSELQRSGVPDGVIQDIQGWASAEMLNVYSDLETDEQLGKYFDENGVKVVEQTKLSDI